ncbi:acyl-CoA dehydrogenase family protein [Streptomyces melanosporofaciens]|uniref:acyl-CoA dehydrogenase family protein n=1 Tax=Streptomyces melanosporofaciens TaxID=67327 RepID=UPI001FCABA66|nr:acyl-CoA dehydrogenase family protein [Streptomyces melanosporofaciens]
MAITEEHAGSDPSRIRTTATRDGDGYVLSGEKWFVTVGDAADFLIVLAYVRPDNEPTMFLVDKDTPASPSSAPPLHPHLRLRTPRVPLPGRPGRPGRRARQDRRGYDLTRDWFTEERLMIAARTIAPPSARYGWPWTGPRSVSRRGRTDERQLIQGMIADS